MIDEEYFLGFPFPWLLRDKTGYLISNGDGALFPLSTRIKSDEELPFLLRSGYGWTHCPSGYAAYTTSISSDEMIWLVVYGLKIAGISTSRGRERTLSIRLTRASVEAYVKRSIDALRQSKEKLNLVMRTNIHEVRSINADIYNAVYRLKGNLEKSQYDSQRDSPIVKNIEELSKFLKTRTDVLDVLSNPALLQAARSLIPVYRAFHRIVHSLNPTALAKGIRMNLRGASTNRVSGISLFDVIPYLIIQNAIKYSPRNTDIEIRFDETEESVYVQVISVGPYVDEEEMERIFLSGYRGRLARRVTAEGTGVGMYLVKMLVELHDGGKISFSQDDDGQVISGIPYRTTRVDLVMKLSK